MYIPQQQQSTPPFFGAGTAPALTRSLTSPRPSSIRALDLLDKLPPPAAPSFFPDNPSPLDNPVNPLDPPDYTLPEVLSQPTDATSQEEALLEGLIALGYSPEEAHRIVYRTDVDKPPLVSDTTPKKQPLPATPEESDNVYRGGYRPLPKKVPQGPEKERMPTIQRLNSSTDPEERDDKRPTIDRELSRLAENARMIAPIDPIAAKRMQEAAREKARRISAVERRTPAGNAIIYNLRRQGVPEEEIVRRYGEEARFLGHSPTPTPT
ncbi:MAG: hypothetical protein D6812_02940, partial [Deltaproteobacteria bacterium]